MHAVYACGEDVADDGACGVLVDVGRHALRHGYHIGSALKPEDDLSALGLVQAVQVLDPVMGEYLGGIDALVFTAGIGEHQPPVRAMVAQRLAWLGLVLDDAANATNAPCFSNSDSRIAALVIPADEERVIADEALGLLGNRGTV